MKILSSEQIRQLDRLTIEREPISSVDLMERAASVCSDWILDHFERTQHFLIICGQGNNGGDGLVIARQLVQAERYVDVIVCPIGQSSEDFSHNLKRLESECRVQPTILDFDTLPVPHSASIVVDALFGSGLNRPLEGHLAALAIHLCRLPNIIVAIDMPSGVFADTATSSQAVCADFTLSFEFPKPAFFMPENHKYIGEWVILPIGIDAEASTQMRTDWLTLELHDIQRRLKQRDKYDHKGQFGHALLITGCYGMAGAAVLSARAALRAGLGLLTVHIPGKLCEILQISVPEAIVDIDVHDLCFTGAGPTEKFSVIGIGCGIGKHDLTREGFRELLGRNNNPMVIDADALNIISDNSELLQHIPENSILTPHPGEFHRLFGPAPDHFHRLETLCKMSARHRVIIVLKGAHTAIGLPDGKVYFNTTGNPGMATGGSGDVLTGIITGLLSQGYTPEDAAVVGVFLHGLAGDCAAEQQGQEALIASDIIDHLGEAYQKIRQS